MCIRDRGNTKTEGYWDKLSLRTLSEDLYDQQRRLTSEAIKFAQENATPLDTDMLSSWFEANEKQLDRFNRFIVDIKSSDHIELPMLTVALKRIQAICGN